MSCVSWSKGALVSTELLGSAIPNTVRDFAKHSSGVAAVGLFSALGNAMAMDSRDLGTLSLQVFGVHVDEALRCHRCCE